MNSGNQENELQRREKELQAREHAIRLRELEAEVNQPPLSATTKQLKSSSLSKHWSGKLLNIGKFLALVVAVVISLRIATSLAMVVMVGAVAWIGYKLFLENKNS